MFEAETVTLAVPVNERAHMVGPKSALVTVVNYGEYQRRALFLRTVTSEPSLNRLLRSFV
jgi:hypothetical protein